MQFKANAYLKDPDTIELDFDTKSTDYYLFKVQHLPTRYFDPRTGKWTTPFNKVNVDYLKKIGFKLDPDLLKVLKNKPKPKPIDPKLKLKPRQYQKEGIGFIDSRNGRALLGDDAGLGKSFQAIGWMHHRNIYPTLVVCPASIKLNWQREIEKFLGKESTVLYSSPKKMQRLEDDIYIINYDILDKWKEVLLKNKFKLMIIDESQAIKNHKAKRTKAVLKLSTKIPHVIPMTATALENGPMDLFTTFKVIDKKRFPNRHNFGVRYCGAINDGWGWKYTGASNLDELVQQLDDIMIRRKKSEVLPELPDKTKIVVPLELENRQQYITAEKKFLQWWTPSQKKVSAMAKMEELQKITNKGKFKQIIEWVGNYLESGNKLIVFGIHIKLVEDIFKEFSKQSVLLYGKQTPKQKQDSIDKFQNSKKIRLMSANIKSGGVGLNLTAAPVTCVVELPWNPAVLEQLESRVHRIGQTADKIFNYYLLAPRTLEEDRMALLDAKQIVMDKVLNGKDTPTDDLFTELIKKMRNRNKKG